jgi:hypothetical integral membrane protein (TIGR02206 family)
MDQFFAKDYMGKAFELFGVNHLFAIGILLLCLFLLYFLRNRFNENGKRAFRIVLAVVLVINELGWHIWNAAIGEWNIQTMLPFHLCSILIWLSAYMLIKKSYRIYEFAYLLGIIGAMQAVLTPDVGAYGFPHYRFFQTFISHGGIILAACYMTWLEGFRPIPASLVRVIVGSNLYLVLVGLINWLVGSNYLFIAHKPVTASLLDVLPEWPIYILYIEGLAIFLCLFMYLPFAVQDFRSKKQTAILPG